MNYTGSLPPDHGGHGRTVSRTLEYNYNDFCVAQVGRTARPPDRC
ncbi:glycoside hydrolase domain-containing protein [Streptomyces coelicoflavus]